MTSVRCQFFRELRNNHEHEEALRVELSEHGLHFFMFSYFRTFVINLFFHDK